MLVELAIFREEFPTRVLEAITRAIHLGCHEASKKAGDYPEDQLVDAVPWLRRLEVNKQFGELVLPLEFRVSRKRTNSATYFQIETNRVVLTTLTRARHVDQLPEARYRKTLAKPTQLDLYTPEEPLRPDQKLYGVVLYGGHLKARSATMAKIAFPLPDGHFFPEKIHLLHEFPHLAIDLGLVPPVEVETAEPILKKTEKPETDEGA